MPTVEELLVRIEGDASSLRDALAEADEQVQTFGSKAAAIGGTIAKGAAVAAGALLAIGAAGVAAASSFEDAFLPVQQNVRGTADEVQLLEDDLRQMATEGGTSFQELSGAAALLGTNFGIVASDMTEAVDSVAQFSDATGQSVDEAADRLGKLARATQTGADGMDNLANAALVLQEQTGAASNSTIDFATKVAPVAQTLGFTSDQVLALGATFVASGVDAQKGAGAVNQALQAMSASIAVGTAAAQGQEAVTAANAEAQGLLVAAMAEVEAAEADLARARSSGDEAAITSARNRLDSAKDAASAAKDQAEVTKAAFGDTEKAIANLEGMARIAGVSAIEFSNLFSTDAPAAMDLFVKGLQSAQAAGEDVQGMLDAAGLKGDAVAAQFFKVAQSGVSLGDAMNTASTALGNTDELAERAAMKAATFSDMLDRVKNMGMELAATVGEALLPAFSGIVGAIGPAMEAIAPLVKDMAGLVAEALADLLPAVQPLLEAVIELIKGLMPPLKAVLGPIMALAKTLATVLTPIVQALTPILVMVADVLGRILGPVLTVVNQLVAALGPVIGALLVALTPLIEVVLNLVMVALQPFLDILGPLVEAFMPVILAVADVIKILAEGLTPIIVAITPLIAGLAKWLADHMLPVLKAWYGILADVAKFIGSVLKQSLEWLGDVVRWLVGKWEPVSKFFSDLWDGVVSSLKGAADLIGDVWDGIWDGIKGVINLILGGVNTVIRALNSLQVEIPDWVPGVGGQTWGMDIPEVPYLDVGGEILETGMAVVHEGEMVVPAAQVKSLRDKQPSGFGSVFIGNITVPVTEAGQDFDPERVADAIEAALRRSLRQVAV